MSERAFTLEIEMKFIIIIMTLLFLSCSSCQHSTFTKTPNDAGIHTLYFEYLKNNIFISSLGIDAEVLNGDDERLIRVLIPKGAKGHLVVLDDGNETLSFPINGEKNIDVHLEPMPYNTKTSTIGLALATQNYGVMSGRLYLIGNLNVTDSMKVKFECPYKTDRGPVATCIRPEKFNLFLTVDIEDDFVGKMKVSTKGECISDTSIIDVNGIETINVKILNAKIGYCNVRLDLRQNKVSGVWKINKFKEININYYDGEYIPITKPEITGEVGDRIIRLKEKYKSYYLNGGFHKAKKKIKARGDIIHFIFWDKHGRVDYDKR